MTAVMTTAEARAERILCSAAVVLRLGGLLLVLVVPFGAGTRSGRTALLAAILAVTSIVFVLVVLRAERLPRTAVVLDVLVVAAVLWLSAGPALLSGPTAETPFVSFALMVATGTGVVDWPWWTVLAVAAVPGTAVAGPLLLAGAWDHPLRTVLPDSVAPLIAALIAALVARLLRRWGREYDRSRDVIVRRADALAREQVRVRQGEVLRDRLVGTIEEVLASGDLTDPGLAEQAEREVAWLRGLIDVGAVDPPPDLGTGLRQLAAEKANTGLRVLLDLPEELPGLPPRQRAALLDATREALTNVVKHAGVPAAGVRVTAGPDGITVEIWDSGQGYDPATIQAGHGLRNSILGRLAAVGGDATVDGSPGRGTRVRLHLPGGVR